MKAGGSFLNMNWCFCKVNSAPALQFSRDTTLNVFCAVGTELITKMFGVSADLRYRFGSDSIPVIRIRRLMMFGGNRPGYFEKAMEYHES